MVSLPNLNTLLPLIRQLYAFGEITRGEVSLIRAGDWWNILKETNFVDSNPSDMLLTATPLLLTQPPELRDIDLLRVFGFRYPLYREYLLMILILGMVNAAQTGVPNLLNRIESWVFKDVASLTPEINAIIDKLEIGKNRLMDLAPEDVQAIFKKRFDESLDFDHWDKVLLGYSAAPSELFSAVLEKFGKIPLSKSVDESPSGCTIALLPWFPIVDHSDDLSGALIPVPWTTSRETVFSSLPLFNATGNPLYDLNKPTEIVWQDALAQQPYYRVVMHLAYAHRLGIGEADQVVLLAKDTLMSTSIEVGGHPVGLLSEYLSKIVQALGYYPILSEEIAAQRTANLLQNLIAVHILSWEDGILSLVEDYALSLGMRPRVQTLSRGQGKQERNTIIAYLHREITKQRA